MRTDQNREAALSKLLTKLFDGNGAGLLRWGRLRLGKGIQGELPTGVPLGQLAFDATLAIQRHGRADQAAFDSLRALRPGWTHAFTRCLGCGDASWSLPSSSARLFAPARVREPSSCTVKKSA